VGGGNLTLRRFLPHKLPSLLWDKHEVQVAWESVEGSSIESYKTTRKKNKKNAPILWLNSTRKCSFHGPASLRFVGFKCGTLLSSSVSYSSLSSSSVLLSLWYCYGADCAYESMNLLRRFGALYWVGYQILWGRLTLGWLMSYIYGAPILDVSRSHTTTQHSR